MAEVEERQFGSLAERIAALNQQKNFSSSGKRAPPPPPGRLKSDAQTNGNGAASEPSPIIPERPQKRETAPVLPYRTTTNTEAALESSPAAPGRRGSPPLPCLANANSSHLEPSPALPPRRPSTQMLGVRRASNSSDMSHVSTVSSLLLNPISSTSSATSNETQSTRRLPPTLDQAKLVPLPPTKREREAQAKEAADREGDCALKTPLKSIKSAPVIHKLKNSPNPSLPPRLPSRPARSPNLPARDSATPVLSARRLTPSTGGYVRQNTAIEPSRPPARTQDVPPPVPLVSRPSCAQIDAVASRAATSAVITCLICRDFSRPDALAAQYPRESLPRSDPVGYLANMLCSPFKSATDKARAIFTWCHHNIVYNVEEFFANCIKQRSVEETIFYGKAVCQGYAETYMAIARRAGLQCVLVSGHGKGYGHNPVAKGQPPPPRDVSGHAWNAVCIDNGEWKLLDACWGAGALMNGKYKQRFAPEMFCLSNELLGLKHYPKDGRHFYRKDGRVPTWEEYMLGPFEGEQAQWCGHATDEGLSQFNFTPAQKLIPVHSNEIVRFQFSKVCQHWNPENHGKGKNYLLMMKIFGVDGRKESFVPLETNGSWWWTDIRARDLGAPGQNIFLYAMTTLNKKDARGATKDDYYRAINGNGCSMAWDIYCVWELA